MAYIQLKIPNSKAFIEILFSAIAVRSPDFFKKERTLDGFAKLAFPTRLRTHPDEKTPCRPEKNRPVFSLFFIN
jgi:hypothetical protein